MRRIGSIALLALMFVPALVLLALVLAIPQGEHAIYSAPGGLRIAVPEMAHAPHEPPNVSWHGTDSCTVFVGFPRHQFSRWGWTAAAGKVVDLRGRWAPREVTAMDDLAAGDLSFDREWLTYRMPSPRVPRVRLIGLVIPFPRMWGEGFFLPGRVGLAWQPHGWGLETLTVGPRGRSRVLLRQWVWNSEAQCNTEWRLVDPWGLMTGFLTHVHRGWIVRLWPRGAEGD